MMPDALVPAINTAHAVDFVLEQKYADGEQGAYALFERRTGQRAVLKWHGRTQDLRRLQHITRITQQLHNVGYPAPLYAFQGRYLDGVYSLQWMLPGSPMYQLRPAFLPRLLELNNIQRQMSLPESAWQEQWPQEVVNTVLNGGNGYCEHESLLRHSAESRAVLREIQQIVATNRAEVPRKDGLVHFDFQPYNILVQDAEVTGVIDWDGCRPGDSAFDLVTLLFYSYENDEVHKVLWQHCLALTPIAAIRVYLSHLVLRQTDWSLRFYGPEEGERYLRRAQAVLQDLRSTDLFSEK